MMDYRKLARYAYFGMLSTIADKQRRLIDMELRHATFGSDAVPENEFLHRLDTLSPLMPKDFDEEMTKRRAELDELTREARELGKLLTADNDAAWAQAVKDIAQRHGLKPRE
jgi:hypothetical protein